MALTDVQIRKAKPNAKLAKLTDGGGLQLWIFPEGAKRWRLAYRFGGKQKLLAIGVYADVSLVEARAARENARKLLADGIDPGMAKRAARAAKATAAAGSMTGRWPTRWTVHSASASRSARLPPVVVSAT